MQPGDDTHRGSRRPTAVRRNARRTSLLIVESIDDQLMAEIFTYQSVWNRATVWRMHRQDTAGREVRDQAGKYFGMIINPLKRGTRESSPVYDRTRSDYWNAQSRATGSEFGGIIGSRYQKNRLLTIEKISTGPVTLDLGLH